MKVSELLADLKDHRQDAPVLVIENDAILPENMLTIESIIKEENTVVLLKVRSINRNPSGTLVEALIRGSGKVLNMKIYESVERPGKFQISIDGTVLQQHFESQDDAKLFIQGFTFGFSAGSGSTPA
jgi:hypothetical protein